MLDALRILRETFVARAELLPAVGSTNDRAAQCAARGVREMPLLVAAEEQTAGRGRGANRWWTGRGSLAFSLLIEPKTVGDEEKRSPLVALASAVALADAVAPLLSGRRLGIHWPNDVMAEGRKLAGILVEALADRRYVIGIGLNLNNTAADAPAGLQETIGTLFDMTGRRFDPNDAIVELLRRMELEFSRLRDNPAEVAARADALCLDRDRIVTLRWDGRETSGRLLGIAADGAIRLETTNGVEAFYSGSYSPT
jgi:BirA family transcriptional regulator, biotin operon repressor / biotin---[acetyl-CoA-carboxylase] ligase